MIKFDILDRFSRNVQFTAEIDCDDSASRSVKVGLAVLAAIKTGADLRGADLTDTDLTGAALCLIGAVGSDYLRLIQTDVYQIAYTAEHIQIGCEKHSIDEWMGFDDKRIRLMGGLGAVEWWRTWKPIIKQMIEAAPAKPTKGTEQ